MTKIMQEVYAKVALQYLEYGVSPIPLEAYNQDDPKSTNPKKPKINNWQKLCRQLIAEKRVKNFCQNQPENNIGIALGAKLMPEMQLAAIDIDDDRAIALVEALLGKITCSKRGVKGKTIFAMMPDHVKSKRIRICGESKPSVEVLLNGSQTVIPPSIHPDTGKPYIWDGDGKALYEYQPEELPTFDGKQLKLLEIILKSENTSIILNGNGTHDATLKLVGQLVAAGYDKNEIISAISALFPKGYDGNSLKELPNMIESAMEKGFYNPTSSGAKDIIAAQMLLNAESPFVFTKSKEFLKYINGFWHVLNKNVVEQKVLAILEGFSLGMIIPALRHSLKCIELCAYDSDFGNKNLPLICCNNGTVNVVTGELLAHSPDHQLRYHVDMEYNPTLTCVNYDNHVRRTFVDDEQSIACWDEFCGYSLIATNKYQKALYLIGEGGGGKSTLFKVLQIMHDPRAISVTPLTKIDSERHLTEIANKLLCISSDIQPKDNARAYGEAFVRITGSDPITTRRLYQEVEGNVQTKVRFMGSMNRMPPKFISAPDALKRRLIFLPCGSKIENPDPDFADKLMAERSGILTRWIKAYQRLEQRGHFDVPESSKKMVSEYLDNQHSVQVFIDEELTINANAHTPIAEIFKHYREWAHENDEARLSKSELGRKLQEFGLKRRFKKLPRSNTENLVNTRVYNVTFTTYPRPF